MKSKKTTTATTVTKKELPRASEPVFERENYLWMAAGIAVMIIGFLLMSGGKSDDPNVFKAEEVYSTRRITIAPILILAGLVVLIFSIFRQPKNR